MPAPSAEVHRARREGKARIVAAVHVPPIGRTNGSPAAFYLVRHGQTASNLQGRYAGYAADPLTSIGRSQMERLADRLAGEAIGEIWSSEVARARESAEILAQRLRLPVHTDSRLNEMRLGAWEGLTEAEVADRFSEQYDVWLSRPDALELDGRESLASVALRIGEVLAGARQQTQPVLLVTHVAPIRVAVLGLLGFPLSLYKRVPVENAECLMVGSGGGSVKRLGHAGELASELNLAALMPSSAPTEASSVVST